MEWQWEEELEKKMDTLTRFSCLDSVHYFDMIRKKKLNHFEHRRRLIYRAVFIRSIQSVPVKRLKNDEHAHKFKSTICDTHRNGSNNTWTLKGLAVPTWREKFRQCLSDSFSRCCFIHNNYTWIWCRVNAILNIASMHM